MNKSKLVEYLKSYRDAQYKIKILKNKIADLNRLIEEPKGMTISEIGPVDGGKHLPRHDQIAKLFDLVNEYYKMVSDAEILCLEIAQSIHKLNNPLEAMVLEMYYCTMSNMRVYTIANELNYSIGYTNNLISNAVNHLAEIL